MVVGGRASNGAPGARAVRVARNAREVWCAAWSPEGIEHAVQTARSHVDEAEGQVEDEVVLSAGCERRLGDVLCYRVEMRFLLAGTNGSEPARLAVEPSRDPLSTV